MGELKEGVHVRPEQGSGPKWEKTLLILVASLAESSIETVPSWLLTEPFDERPARRESSELHPDMRLHIKQAVMQAVLGTASLCKRSSARLL